MYFRSPKLFRQLDAKGGRVGTSVDFPDVLRVNVADIFESKAQELRRCKCNARTREPRVSALEAPTNRNRNTNTNTSTNLDGVVVCSRGRADEERRGGGLLARHHSRVRLLCLVGVA